MVSDVLSIKITTGQTQINLTDLTDRVKQAEDRISLNESKLLAYEKDLKLRLQKLARNLEQIHKTGRGDGGVGSLPGGKTPSGKWVLLKDKATQQEAVGKARAVGHGPVMGSGI